MVKEKINSLKTFAFRTLGYALIFSLIAPHLGQCMEEEEVDYIPHIPSSQKESHRTGIDLKSSNPTPLKLKTSQKEISFDPTVSEIPKDFISDGSHSPRKSTDKEDLSSKSSPPEKEETIDLTSSEDGTVFGSSHSTSPNSEGDISPKKLSSNEENSSPETSHSPTLLKKNGFSPQEDPKIKLVEQERDDSEEKSQVKTTSKEHQGDEFEILDISGGEGGEGGKKVNHTSSLFEDEEVPFQGGELIVLEEEQEDLVPPEFLEATLKVIQGLEEEGPHKVVTFRFPALKFEQVLSEKKGKKGATEISPLLIQEDDIESQHVLTNFAPSFALDFKDLDPKDLAPLTRLHSKIIKEKWSCPEKWGLALGTFIGCGMAVAMGPVFEGGILYLRDHYHISFVKALENGILEYAIVIPYITLSILPDAVPRNISFWKKAFISLKEKTVEWGRVLKTTLSVFPPSLLEPTYLILLELHNMNVEHVHGLNNPFAPWMVALCPILFTDAMASNFDLAWEAQDDFKGWLQKSKSSLARGLRSCLTPCFGDFRLSPEASLRRTFGKTLKTLNRTLLTAPSSLIRQIYRTVFDSEESLREQLQPQEGEALSEDEFKKAQGFLTLRYLLSLGQELPVLDDNESSSSALRTGILVTGSPVRLMALEFVLETLLNLFLPTRIAKGLGWALAGLSFPIQTALEYKGLKNFSELWRETHDGHNSHPGVRKGIKAATMVQAVIFTLPMIVLVMQMFDTYGADHLWMISSLPFLLAEFAAQATSFHETYDKKVTTTCTDLHNLKTRKCKNLPPRTDYMRDRLMRKVQDYSEDLKKIPPAILFKLSELLGIQQDSHSMKSFVELIPQEQKKGSLNTGDDKDPF